MIKIKTGFEKEQHYSIPDEEAHKAYYLFLHPEKRGTFNSGLALVGKHIQSIEPDYQGTMGWNSTHTLDEDDWNDIRNKGVDRKLRDVLSEAKKVAYLIPNDLSLLQKPLSKISEVVRLN